MELAARPFGLQPAQPLQSVSSPWPATGVRSLGGLPRSVWKLRLLWVSTESQWPVVRGQFLPVVGCFDTMTDSQNDDLLARLAAGTASPSGPDPLATLAATEPDHDQDQGDQKLDALIERINNLSGEAPPSDEQPGEQPQSAQPGRNDFVPVEPASIEDAQLTESEVEALALKYLLARGDATGRTIADQLRLPFVLVDELLRRLKAEQLVVHRADAPMNDFHYQMSDLGRERAQRLTAHCTYFGSAPVSLRDYIVSVKAQSMETQHPETEDLLSAFDDLLLSPKVLSRLGPAMNSGRGLFLYGAPGNGKTSIAERVTRAFGQYIWIPRAIGIDGEIIRLYDPVNHEEIPVEQGTGLWDQRKIDKRWVRIRRPTIVAGGELTMSSLEVTINTSTGISEAPLQLKSNCGTLVIDDFGRQKMPVDTLLNRWIVPLEKRFDFLNLPNGKKIQVPFDQLIIFSTNLEPRDLVDEAFLRRIPYKIEIVDPTEEEFRDLFKMMAANLDIEYRPETIDYLIERHYRATGRPFRCCHPRDLLLQIRSRCKYERIPVEMTNEHFDQAVENYFSVM